MNEAEALLEKYNNGTATKKEIILVESWYLRYKTPDGDLTSKQIEEEYKMGLADLSKRLDKHPVRLWPRIAAVASILLFLSVGAYFLLRKPQTETEWIAQNFKNDILPGTNSATLKLGNGKLIVLSTKANGQLAVQGNMAVKKTADGQLVYQVIGGKTNEVMQNTLTTQRKEQYKVVLADGTSVWLNASSSIQYPTSFNGKYRDVTITGEAYFEVAHNALKPFRVISAGQTVEVLGTHFNINTYADEPGIKTTLIEGSVKVTNNNSSEVIKPGEQALLKGNQLSVKQADIEETLAWKNGYFRFNNENIESIMRKLSRWYDIDVSFEGPVSQVEYDGDISRFRNISDVLKRLQYSGYIHFKIEGRRVTVVK